MTDDHCQVLLLLECSEAKHCPLKLCRKESKVELNFFVLIQDQGRTFGVRVAHYPEWAEDTPGCQHHDVSKQKSAFLGKKMSSSPG